MFCTESVFCTLVHRMSGALGKNHNSIVILYNILVSPFANAGRQVQKKKKKRVWGKVARGGQLQGSCMI